MKSVEQHLTIQEIADRLGVDYSTVWRWIQDGKLSPVRKLGHSIVRIPVSAVDRFLATKTV